MKVNNSIGIAVIIFAAAVLLLAIEGVPIIKDLIAASKPQAKNSAISVNKEVKYVQPQPAVAMEGSELIEELKGKIVIFHNGRGEMCLGALGFLETIDYPVEQHFESEAGFNEDIKAEILELVK